jgi:hypothetical protein
VLKGPAQHSRRLLAVLSPSLLHDSWTSAALYEALHTLLTVHNKIICIALQVQASDLTMYLKYRIRYYLVTNIQTEWQTSLPFESHISQFISFHSLFIYLFIILTTESLSSFTQFVGYLSHITIIQKNSLLECVFRYLYFIICILLLWVPVIMK